MVKKTVFTSSGVGLSVNGFAAVRGKESLKIKWRPQASKSVESNKVRKEEELHT